VIRLYVVVEGSTEQAFATSVLYPHLLDHGAALTAPLIGKPGHKGGRVNYARARRDVLLFLKQDRNAYCTTLFDFYGRGKGFADVPASAATADDKAKAIEHGFHADVVNAMGSNFRPERFIPYVQMHEFEGLLFSEPTELAKGIGVPALSEDFAAMREQFHTPEDIDDGPTTAPSKRIVALAPRYQKVVDGNLVANRIGLPGMRQECRRFDAWIRSLESLGSR